MKKFIKSTVSAFIRDKKGATAVIFAGAIPIFLTVLGTSFDYNRFLDARQNVARAIDSASLGVASAIANGEIDDSDDDAIQARAREIFDLNVVASNSANNGVDNFVARLNRASSTIEVNVNLDVPTTITSVFGVDSFSDNLSSSSAFAGIPGGAEQVEFSFVLDVTGSMAGSRLETLKEALRNTMNVLLPEGRTPNSPGINDDRVRVGLVPYSTSVNLGSYYRDAVGTRTESGRFGRNTCVTEREGVNAFSDVAPSGSRFNNTLYETHSFIRRLFRSASVCPDVSVRPLTNDREALLQDIDSLTAAGATGGHMGIDWGINLLAQPWQSFWPAGSRPANYNAEGVRKVLVVMTDGAFNTAFYDNTTNPSGGNLNLPRFANIFTATSQFEESERAARNFCDFAKLENNNIEVYTIAFQAGRRAENLLFDCATQPERGESFVRGEGPYFYRATNNAALVDAFRNIVARELEVLLVN